MKIFDEWVFQVTDRAEAQGVRLAQLAGPVDWERLGFWVQRVRRDDFVWEACDGWNHEPIIIGPGADGTLAIHAGACRYLASVLADKPVPDAFLTQLEIEDPTRPWEAPAPTLRLEVLVPLHLSDRSWAGPIPAGLCPIGGR